MKNARISKILEASVMMSRVQAQGHLITGVSLSRMGETERHTSEREEPQNGVLTSPSRGPSKGKGALL